MYYLSLRKVLIQIASTFHYFSLLYQSSFPSWSFIYHYFLEQIFLHRHSDLNEIALTRNGSWQSFWSKILKVTTVIVYQPSSFISVMNDEYSRNASCPKYSRTFMTLLLPKVVIFHFVWMSHTVSHMGWFILTICPIFIGILRKRLIRVKSQYFPAFQQKPQNVKNTCCETIKTIKYCWKYVI